MDTVSVHEIIFDRALTPRQQPTDPAVVDLYAAIFREVIWPPILVHRETRKLIDGWHRVEAGKRAGVYTLPVTWVDAKEEDLFSLAVKANLAHGVRLSREERCQAILHLQRAAWTTERIVEVLGCGRALVERTEQADDLRIRYRVENHPAAALPVETLVEVTRLPAELQDEVAGMACEVEAAPADVRRAVRAVNRGEITEPQQVRRALADPAYLKTRRSALADAMPDARGLLAFAEFVDRVEGVALAVSPMEREAAAALVRRLRGWADRQLALLGTEQASLPVDSPS